MDLYFLPLACSMATRICLYEAGAAARFVEVDPNTKLASTGESLFTLNPTGLVPTVRLDDGELLTENITILQHLAETYPHAGLAPSDAIGRRKLRTWLSFVATELHKACFGVMLDAKAPPEAKTFAAQRVVPRLDRVAAHLEGREHVLDAFSVVDAYLVTVLGWSVVTPVDLGKWPVLEGYVARTRQRPSVARALAEEFALYTKSKTAPRPDESNRRVEIPSP